MTEKEVRAVDAAEEKEFYEEPPALTKRDLLGVAAALATLLGIGICGYIWLNPDLSYPALWDRTTSGGSPSGSPSLAVKAGQDESNSADSAPSGPTYSEGTLDSPHTHTHDMSCAQCGMYSDRSTTHIVLAWQDETHSHFCCWDCAFKWQQSQQAVLSRALVVAYTGAVEDPVWLEATEAIYLVGTSRLAGSMPPFVAAFATRETATAARAELGGEITNWQSLQLKLANQHSGQ